MKRDHENNVLRRLGMIQGWAAGRAVFAELRAWRSFSVYILPFDFLPSDDWESEAKAITEPDYTSAIGGGTGPREDAARARRSARRGACWANPDSHAGKSADVFYTARRFPEPDADGALLHELVHAARLISGVQRTSPWAEATTTPKNF